MYFGVFICVLSRNQARDMHLVTVYDIKNKLIAYSGPVPEVVDVLCEWGSLYILGGDMKVSQEYNASE